MFSLLFLFLLEPFYELGLICFLFCFCFCSWFWFFFIFSLSTYFLYFGGIALTLPDNGRKTRRQLRSEKLFLRLTPEEISCTLYLCEERLQHAKKQNSEGENRNRRWPIRDNGKQHF
jgi:hypothetical protein